jgi:hypothetical protein
VVEDLSRPKALKIGEGYTYLGAGHAARIIEGTSGLTRVKQEVPIAF